MDAYLPAAVLWDMDGTLVKTEDVWIEAEKDLVESHGGVWTDEQALALVGNDLRASGAMLREWARLPMTVEEVVDHLVEQVLREVRQGVVWQPGALELLAELNHRGVPCGLVTMSYAVLADAVMSQLPLRSFATVVTGDEVTHGKPHPEPYLTAAARLGVDPRRCVVIEDSPTGAASGLAAGARVIAVPQEVPVLPQHGLAVASSLEGLPATELLGFFEPAMKLPNVKS